jgi:hypothetical protein
LKEAQVETAVSKKLAFAMFGKDAFTSGDFLDTAIATFISVVIALTWNRYRKMLKRQKSNLERKAKDMEDKWNGELWGSRTLIPTIDIVHRNDRNGCTPYHGNA